MTTKYSMDFCLYTYVNIYILCFIISMYYIYIYLYSIIDILCYIVLHCIPLYIMYIIYHVYIYIYHDIYIYIMYHITEHHRSQKSDSHVIVPPFNKKPQTLPGSSAAALINAQPDSLLSFGRGASMCWAQKPAADVGKMMVQP